MTGLPISHLEVVAFCSSPCSEADILWLSLKASATYTHLAQPTLMLSSAVAAPKRANAADQFTVQIRTVTTTASVTTADSGTIVTSGSTGAVTLAVGTTYTMTEVTAAGSSSALPYYIPSGVGQSYTVIPNGNDAITCTLTNTRKNRTLQLQKVWAANSIAGDNISLPATTGFTNNASVLTSTATAADNTDSGLAATVYAGETGTLAAESFTAGSSMNYGAVLNCTGNATALSGTNGPTTANTLTIAAADTTVVYNDTNSRAKPTIILTKFQRIAAAPDATPAAPDFNFTVTALTGLLRDVLEYCIIYSNTGGMAPRLPTRCRATAQRSEGLRHEQ
ncbi:hypothetical protein [Deinococcus ruber]|uniref:SpaA-like prealbumin fold domain-containing protein n=1 Tax=Deinococcus ruber TaxID=1848197 RepID=A0A918C820_9DEIO|nr:hypothetical protein [Deinococcus ruber]GGR10443.1 hypothetical protein GCM10008957_23890 [Deinococcus ruber]